MVMVQYDYQGLSKSSGIYVIFNNYNWRIYVGSTKQFFKRWKDGHISSLFKAKHQNKFLQADFNKCKELLGHDDFLEFHILKDMPESTREERLLEEEKWLKVHFDNGKQCYNLSDRAFSREGFTDKKQRKTRCDKGTGKSGYIKKGRKFGLVPWNKGKIDCYSEETLTKMKLAHLGKKLSDEHKQKISVSNFGRSVSKETRQKISHAVFGKNNGNFGKQMTQKCRMALLKANTNRNMTQKTRNAVRASREKVYNVVLCDPFGIEHGPIVDLSKFCQQRGLERSLICKVIEGRRSHHKGWTIKQ